MFPYKSIEFLYQLLKSRHLIVRSISLNPYNYGISNLEIWNHEKKRKKESNSIVLAYIADVSVLTNPRYIICKHCH